MRFQLKTLTDYSDEAILAELRRVVKELNGQRLTVELFNSRARVHPTTVRARFGSWSAAIDCAGVDDSVAPHPKQIFRGAILTAIKRFASNHPNESPTLDMIANDLGVNKGSITRKFGKWEALLAEVGLKPVPLGRRYTDEECFENILALWAHYGRQPYFAELNQSPSTVGSKAYVRRWHGWRRALAAFVERANATDNGEVCSESPSTNGSKAAKEQISGAPRSISLSLRYRVLCRDNFRCVTCGRSPAKDGTVVLNVDHIVPWSRGGKNSEHNLRTLCFDCNIGKGAHSEDYRAG